MRGLDTSIIFELVLIGFQVLIWVFLLVLTVFGYDWLDLAGLKEWSGELSVGLIGVAYMFGLIFDKAVGALPYSWIIGGSPSAKCPTCRARSSCAWKYWPGNRPASPALS